MKFEKVSDKWAFKGEHADGADWDSGTTVHGADWDTFRRCGTASQSAGIIPDPLMCHENCSGSLVYYGRQIGAGKLLSISRLWLQRYIKVSHGKNGLDCDVKFAHNLMTFRQHFSNKLKLLNHTWIGYLKNISQYCGKLADVLPRQGTESQCAAFPNPLILVSLSQGFCIKKCIEQHPYCMDI